MISCKKLTLRATLAASAAIAVCSPAAAQDAPPATPTSDAGQQDAAPGEIIVTAQKRTQVLIDVPQSVTVVGGETLERQQATNFQDYLKLVPGLQLNQSTPGVGRLGRRQ